MISPYPLLLLFFKAWFRDNTLEMCLGIPRLDVAVCLILWFIYVFYEKSCLQVVLIVGHVKSGRGVLAPLKWTGAVINGGGRRQ